MTGRPKFLIARPSSSRRVGGLGHTRSGVNDDPWVSTDPFGEALHWLRMSGAYYCRSELTEPWGLTLPPIWGYLWFHVVTSGRCRLEVEGVEPHDVRPGVLTLVPHGQGHTLRSEPEAAASSIHELSLEPVSKSYEILRHGGGGAPTTLICGAVRFRHPAAHTLTRLLPKIIYVDARNSPESEWLQSKLNLMASEAKVLRPGGETVITRLSDILVIQAIRSWLERDPGARAGWLGALRDRQIGRALVLIQQDPARRWTVASLAEAVAMSRSAFAARFTRLVGQPVMSYLVQWRMFVALGWLTEEEITVADAASRLGYGSEAAFSRAFKRVIGITPGAARKGVGSPRLLPRT
jgi:AraC-like DNA-binding protein